MKKPKTDLKDYIPYGEEWENILMKHNKKQLIDILRHTLNKKQTDFEKIKAVFDDVGVEYKASDYRLKTPYIYFITIGNYESNRCFRFDESGKYKGNE